MEYINTFSSFLVILIFRVIIVITVISDVVKAECQNETLSNVKWSSSGDNRFVASSPQCLDETKFPLTRSCMDGQWSSAPTCNFRQETPSVYNLLEELTGFKPLNRVALINKPRPWSNPCLQFGHSIKLRDYENYLRNLNTDFNEFWLPLKRFKKHYPFIQHTPGSRWGEIVDVEGSEGDCVVMNLQNFERRVVDCSEKYPDICFYDEEDQVVSSNCPIGQFTTRFQQEIPKCYEVNTDSNKMCDRYFSFNTDFEFMTITNILSNYFHHEKCRIQIDPFKGEELFNKSVWTNSTNNRSFVNWASNLRENEIPQEAYVTSDYKGRWHLQPEVSCSICEEPLELRKPKMFLSFGTMLELTILNSEFIWTSSNWTDKHIACYTTGTDALLANTPITRYNESETGIGTGKIDLSTLVENAGFIRKTVFSVQIVGTGEYWCNALSFPSRNVISTGKLIIHDQRDGEVFACYLTYVCPEECSHYFNEDALQDYNVTFNETLKIPELRAARVMEILETSPKEIQFLYHVTFGLKYLDLRESIKLLKGLNSRFKNVDHFKNIRFAHIFDCVDYSNEDTKDLRVLSAKAGETKVIPKMCPDGIVLNYRKCICSFPYEAKWSAFVDIPCSGSISQETMKIYNLTTNPNINMIDVLEVGKLTIEQKIDTTQLYSVGVMMETFACRTSNKIQSQDDLQVITQVLSNAHQTDKSIAKEANLNLNATNTIIAFYEKIVIDLAADSMLNEDSLDEWGVVKSETEHVLTFVIDPSIQNVTGIAIYRPSPIHESTWDARNYSVVYLFDNTSIPSLMKEELLECATFIPRNLARVLHDLCTTSLRIAITAIRNDTLFQSNIRNVTKKAYSWVLMVSIPGLSSELPGAFPTIFRTHGMRSSIDDNPCGFWKYRSGYGNVSEWSNDYCFLLSDYGLAFACACTHFTPFTLLMTGVDTIDDLDNFNPNRLALDFITVTGSCLSLFSILCIWITAIVFRTWRERDGTSLLLQLSYGLAFQLILIMATNVKHPNLSDKLCLTVGIALHYSVLVIFIWMLIIAYLQYRRFVIVFGNPLPNNFFIISKVLGWIVPLVPIIVIISIDSDLYVPKMSNENLAICYPQGGALHYGVILPVAIVITINLVIYIKIIYNITKGIQFNKGRVGNNQMQIAQLKQAIFQFFLLGLTWIFGCLVHFEKDSLVFSYLFCITATLQGFVLFLFSVILDPQTRKLWVKETKCCYRDPNASVSLETTHSSHRQVSKKS